LLADFLAVRRTSCSRPVNDFISRSEDPCYLHEDWLFQPSRRYAAGLGRNSGRILDHSLGYVIAVSFATFRGVGWCEPVTTVLEEQAPQETWGLDVLAEVACMDAVTLLQSPELFDRPPRQPAIGSILRSFMN